METIKIRIQNNEGLHARPASRLVSLCHRFDSNVTLTFSDMEADCKNVTEVLGLGAEKDDVLTVRVSGKDESETKEALLKFFSGNTSGAEKI